MVSEAAFKLIRIVLAELLGTTMLMYSVMAISLNLINLNREGRITTEAQSNPVIFGLAITFIVLPLIYCFADISGAHFNPALSFSTILARKLPFVKGVLYIIAQCTGSIIATLLVMASFPRKGGTQSTASLLVVGAGLDVNILEAFMMEVVLTFILVIVVFSTALDDPPPTKNTIQLSDFSDNNLYNKKNNNENATNYYSVANNNSSDTSVHNTEKNDSFNFDDKIYYYNNNKTTNNYKNNNTQNIHYENIVYSVSGSSKSGFAPLAIALTCGSLVVVGSSISMSVFNPARAFGPALVSNIWTNQWLYWSADFLGAGLACFTQRLFLSSESKKYWVK